MTPMHCATRYCAHTPRPAAYSAMFHRKIRHADHVLMRRARFIQRLHLFQGWPLQEIAFFSYYMREYEVKKVRVHPTARGRGWRG